MQCIITGKQSNQINPDEAKRVLTSQTVRAKENP